MDLELVENGNGGDLVKNRRDLSVIFGFENMVYLALFGGNLDQSTPIKRQDNEQSFDWWGNELFFPGRADLQFNSLTERSLMENALTSSGAMSIQQAVETDLEFMNDFANVSVTVVVLDNDKLAIGVQILQPDNLENKQYIFLWDSTRSELAARADVNYNQATGQLRYFQDYFSFEFE